MVRVTPKSLHIFLCMYHKQNIYISTYLVCNLSSSEGRSKEPLVQSFSGKCCRQIFSVKVDGTLDGNVLVRPPHPPCFSSHVFLAWTTYLFHLPISDLVLILSVFVNRFSKEICLLISLSIFSQSNFFAHSVQPMQFTKIIMLSSNFTLKCAQYF